MQWAFGVRYGEFEQASSVAAYQVCEGDDYAGYASARHAFGGVGLTTALTGVRPIGCGNFSLFYSARASLLWDSNAVTSVQTLATYDGADGSGAVGVNGAAARDQGQLVHRRTRSRRTVELRPEVHSGECLRPRGLRVPVLGSDQRRLCGAWSAAGGLDGTLGTASAASGGDAHTNLLGFSVGAGITY